MSKHSCFTILDDRAATWKRWQTYVRNRPDKYRIIHDFAAASHRTYLQELKDDCDCNPDYSHTCSLGIKSWHYIEKLPTWFFVFGQANLTQEYYE